MHPKYLLVGIMIILSGKLSAQKPDPGKFNYFQLWKDVDTLQKKERPKSALEIVDKIYATAKKEKNASQLLKSVIYKIEINESLEEVPILKNLSFLEEEIKSSFHPVAPVLHSILAEIYWRYYEQNRYRFYDRSETLNFDNNDITTWNLNQLVSKVIQHYQLSLQDAEKLKTTPINSIKEILIAGNKLGKEYRPTLYDFLSHRAIDFFMNNEPEIVQPAYAFTLNSPEYFLEASKFAESEITTRDTFAYKYYALKLFQDLIEFHLKDPKPDALIDIDLKRLEFVTLYSILPKKDELYLNALQKIEIQYKAYPISTVVSYKLAEYWNQKGFEYNPLNAPQHKGARKKAFDICEDAIKRFPESRGALQAYNLQQTILAKEIGAQIEKVNVSGEPFRALVSYRNFSNLYWRVIPVTRDEIANVKEKWDQNYEVDQEQKLLQFFTTKKSLKSGKVVLPADSDFNQHSVEIKIDAVPAGTYVVLFSNNPDFSTFKNGMAYAFTTISNIAYLHRNREDGTTDLYVVNRTSGEPMEGADVNLYYSEYNATKRKQEFNKGDAFKTNAEGYVQIPFVNKQVRNYRTFEIFISKDADTISTQDNNILYEQNYGRLYQRSPQETRMNEQTHFFLDRAIYRPGQTLHYKGLLTISNGKEPKIIPNRKLTIIFYNANAQIVDQQEVTTNQFGTFSGTFITPSTGLMGQMSLSASDNNSSQIFFSVEEYKRPRFEVKLDSIEGSFKLGEKVNVKGKALAYSGANIDEAAVQYRVLRRAIFPYWWWYRHGYYPTSPEMEITNGRTSTKADGSFEINFTAIPDESIGKESSPTFIYQVFADVTDINGETHSNSLSVNIGYKALIVSVPVEDIDKSGDSIKTSFSIKTTNLEGRFEPASGTITIWKLITPAKAYKERLWPKPDKFLYTDAEFHTYFPNDVYADENDFTKWSKEKEALSKQFDTSKDRTLNLPDIKQWDAGKYMLEIKSTDKFGEAVEELAYFDVLDSRSVNPMVPAVFELKNIKVQGEPGETAKLLVSSTENVSYLFEIEQDDKILEKRWGKLDNSINSLEIPIREDHRGNITIHLVTVKNNRMYANERVITVPYTNKQLDIKFETFRDKLNPGQEEQWKITVSSKKAEKIMAEMVTTLYDASLDAFQLHAWYASFYQSFYSGLRWQSLNGFGASEFNKYDRNWNNFKAKKVIQPEYPLLYWANYEIYIDNMERPFLQVESPAEFDAGSERKDKSSRLKKGEQALAVEMDETAIIEREILPPPPPAVNINDIKIRKNFNETAFFYPHLQTNKNGEIVINFSIPEALTRWKMLGFAHTQDLKSGLIQKELVTQKDLMVVPNQPRFFRENDKMLFQAKVNSMLDKDLDGQARLEFFDALTMQPIDVLVKNTDNLRNFKLKAHESTNLVWSIEIPEGLQAITYRVVAKSGNFSDGEEMTIPVVTNRTMVVETLPLSIRGKQSKEFTFEKLVNNTSTTLKNHRYTLEFTSNPAWYAIQALPYLMEYPYECSEQLFSRFYANSIATHISNSNPLIKRVFDSWKTIQPDALLSNLEKNQELKTALLQETPWVLNAKSESERKRNLALLFDLNKMAHEQEKALTKITDAQLGNGGFPWFAGLPEDLYITQYIVSGIGHLAVMGVNSFDNNEKANRMITRAISYMDSRMTDRYNFIKAEAKKDSVKLNDNHLGYLEVQYLYARSYFKNMPIPPENKEAFEFWMEQAGKYWTNQNIYGQGMISLALKRYNNAKVPADIVKSLKEKALISEELGMYWKPEHGYFWYHAPVETQALMIEVFDEVANDSTAVEELKVWLLKQKQTQDWRTTKATAEACYALLRRGTNVLANNKLVEIKVGDEKIDPTKREDTRVEAGTGYFKTAWTASEMKPNMGNIKLKKNDDGIAWGAVYWQYFEQLDKITPAETPLKLSKKLFLQTNTQRGPVISPITDTTLLRTGDLVKVRIELRADRTMEYIHLKDMRASAFEPIETLSGHKYQDGLWYYQSPGDLATNFFIGYLPKGTYVFEYELRVAQVGDFSNGITTIQCMYAPEFSSHSEGIRVKVENKLMLKLKFINE